MRSFAVLTLVVCILSLSGCLNLFGPFDHPTSDPQLLSAARACLDQADFNCALADYAKLSGSQGDTANSEEAFAMFDQAGIGISAFLGAFGTGSNLGGSAITQIAGSLSTHGGTSTRLEIFHAYQKVLYINDQTLRGIVRFVGAIGLISEILGEMAQSPGNLKTTDIAVDPTDCLNLQPPLCANVALTNDCHQGDNNVVSGTVIAGTFATATDPLAGTIASPTPDATIVASFGILYTAIEAAGQGLADMGVSGGNASTLITSLTAGAGFVTDSPSGPTDPNQTNISPCFRQLLLLQGIGNN